MKLEFLFQNDCKEKITYTCTFDDSAYVDNYITDFSNVRISQNKYNDNINYKFVVKKSLSNSNNQEKTLLITKYKTKNNILVNKNIFSENDFNFNEIDDDYVFKNVNVLRVIKALILRNMQEFTIKKGNEMYIYKNIVLIEPKNSFNVRFFADFEQYYEETMIFESINSRFAFPYTSTDVLYTRHKLEPNSTFLPYPLFMSGVHIDKKTLDKINVEISLELRRQYFFDPHEIRYVDLFTGYIKKNQCEIKGVFFFKDNDIMPYMNIVDEDITVDNHPLNKYLIYSNIHLFFEKENYTPAILIPNSNDTIEIDENKYMHFFDNLNDSMSLPLKSNLPNNWYEKLNSIFSGPLDFEAAFVNYVIKNILLTQTIQYKGYIFNLSNEKTNLNKILNNNNISIYDLNFDETIQSNDNELQVSLKLSLLFGISKNDYDKYYSIKNVEFFSKEHKYAIVKCIVNNSIVSLNLDNNVSRIYLSCDEYIPIAYIDYKHKIKEIELLIKANCIDSNLFNHINKSKLEIMKYMIKVKEYFNSKYNNTDYNIDSSKINSESPHIYYAKLTQSKEYIFKNYDMKYIEEEYLKFKDTNKIPYLAFMGAPGVGKTTMAKNIASLFTQKEDSLLICSASDLKGPYVGHTAFQVFTLLKNAVENDKIIFIDEAYHLTNDHYGKEALDILLPIISGDRTEIEVVNVNKDSINSTLKLKFEDGKIPVIWLAGYEPEMRELFANNQGLYRRVVKISLNSPTISELCNTFSKLALDSGLNYLTSSHIVKIVKDYFAWASGKEYINYFGNYAGVVSLFESCRILLNPANIENDNMLDKLHQIILNKKNEIKKQYNACLKEKTDKFKVQSDIDARFKDIGGCVVAKNSLKEIVSLISKTTKLTDKGIFVPRGALLIGPPGTGKTLLSRALAGEVQEVFNRNIDTARKVAFIAVSATELTSAKDVKILFKEAEEFDSCIIFIDEIDAIGRNRKYIDSTKEILIQLMKEMDGFEIKNNIFVLAATNEPNVLDPALKRPGRFDRIIEVDLPDKKERKEIISLYINNLSDDIKANIMEDNALLEKIVSATAAYSPSNIKNLINEAAMKNISCTNALNDINKSYIEAKKFDDIAFDEEKELFEGTTECTLGEKFEEYSNTIYHRIVAFTKDINTNEEILQKLLKNPPKDNFYIDIMETIDTLSLGVINITEKEKEFQTKENEGMSATAIHEVGHALTSYLLKTPPFEKISIISRGNSLGYVQYSSNYKYNTKSKFITHIRTLFGGRIAEELFYGDNISSGAFSDIHRATDIANDMITKFGMNQSIGPVSLKENISSYINYNEEYTCSDNYRKKVDETLESILKEEYETTKALLLEHKALIEKLAKIVFEKETLTGDEFVAEVEKLL